MHSKMISSSVFCFVTTNIQNKSISCKYIPFIFQENLSFEYKYDSQCLEYNI